MNYTNDEPTATSILLLGMDQLDGLLDTIEEYVDLRDNEVEPFLELVSWYLTALYDNKGHVSDSEFIKMNYYFIKSRIPWERMKSTLSAFARKLKPCMDVQIKELDEVGFVLVQFELLQSQPAEPGLVLVGIGHSMGPYPLHHPIEPRDPYVPG